MYSLLIVTHGNLAEELYESLKAIGYLRIRVDTLCIHEEALISEYTKQLRRMIEELSRYGDVIVLTDVKLGTPFNMTMRLMREWEFYHLTGVNLPLLLKLNDVHGLSTTDAIEKSICYAREELMDTEPIKRRALYEISNCEE